MLMMTSVWGSGSSHVSAIRFNFSVRSRSATCLLRNGGETRLMLFTFMNRSTSAVLATNQSIDDFERRSSKGPPRLRPNC